MAGVERETPGGQIESIGAESPTQPLPLVGEIGPDGKIAKVYTGVSPAKHSEEVLAALQELQAKGK